MVKSYRTVSELAQDADEIVEIKVNVQKTILYQEVPFTVSTVSVLNSFKGDHEKGDTIRIIETGGEYTPLDKQGNALPKTTMNFNGISVLQPNNHEVIFLSTFEGPQISGEVYVPLGVYQGRFKVDASGDLIQQAPDEEKVNDAANMNVERLSDTLHKLLRQ
ncbi:hypothetical protein GCM10010918_25280 [Paenibacillus radicis (ex Gao et al. 2016)]|uniref:Uncharacterized protein n=1 Tax=Paenibacillus radicis (ex Gao et al. 2016) TaxID=1737354 RepID=A0A917H721_9BACL|nr:hypothetical protein GCM10010918_25280 [Paenibacillus radicis (ex Gao et al. 2016)]